MMDHGLINYLRESCRLNFDQHISLKHISKMPLPEKKKSNKTVRSFLAATGLNRFRGNFLIKWSCSFQKLGLSLKK